MQQGVSPYFRAAWYYVSLVKGIMGPESNIRLDTISYVAGMQLLGDYMDYTVPLHIDETTTGAVSVTEMIIVRYVVSYIGSIMLGNDRKTPRFMECSELEWMRYPAESKSKIQERRSIYSKQLKLLLENIPTIYELRVGISTNFDGTRARFCIRCRFREGGPECHKLMICSNCKIATYCSSKCQRKDWKHHRDACNEYCMV